MRTHSKQYRICTGLRALGKALALILPLALLPAAPAQAITYLPASDQKLLDGAELVARVRVLEAGAAVDNPLAVTAYRLRIDERFKGAAPEEILLRVPGAYDPYQDNALTVPGAPRLQPDAQALLFLRRLGDGSYALSGLGLGAFVVAGSSGEEFLEHLVSGVENFLLPGQKSAVDTEGRVRDLSGFSRWLREGGDEGADANYWRAAPPAAPPQRKYALLGNPPVRWFEFNENHTVEVYANSEGAIGLLSGGYPEFQEALAAWNDDGTSTIRYHYAGRKPATGGLEHADGINAIVFNDPNAELAGVFDCVHGGVVAYGGYRTRSGARAFGGHSFQSISEMDIVVQNGTGCILSALGSRAAEVFAHEVGHTLGLAHSCSDDGQPACQPGSAADEALMRPYMHGDGRGAKLASDDRNAVAYLYPGGGSAPLPPDAVGSGNNLSGSTPEESSGGDSGGGALGLPLLGLLALAGCARRRRFR